MEHSRSIVHQANHQLQYVEWRTKEINKPWFQSNEHALCALNKEEFNRVLTARSATQIWQILQVTHEGTKKVKKSKISVLVHRFELFKMKENETIAEMVTRFTDITNSLSSFENEYTQVEKVRKVLCALASDWEKKTTAIEEANNL